MGTNICVILTSLFVINNIINFVFYYLQRRKLIEARHQSDKHLSMFLLMDTWLYNKSQGKDISEYLREKGFKSVIIYGTGYVGKQLYRDLKNKNFKITDLIDQNTKSRIDGKKVKSFDEKIEPADVIIVTSIYYFEVLEGRLKEKFNIPILSLEDIIYKM